MYAPSSPVRERERGDSEEERKNERRIEKDGEEYLFLKGIMGALAPFSYLVII